jgi:ribosomal protein L6P/L9E
MNINVALNKEFFLLKRIVINVGCLNNLRFYFVVNGPFGSLCYFMSFLPQQQNERYYLTSKVNLTTFLTLLKQTIDGVTVLHKYFLQMVGVGYKSYIPRTRHFKYLVLKVGFGSVDLGYTLGLSIKGRARKQKFLLVSTDLNHLTNTVRTIINLKYPNSYTGKGIRMREQNILLKKSKQQQRSK